MKMPRFNWRRIVVIIAFNFMGDGLRDAADPYGH